MSVLSRQLADTVFSCIIADNPTAMLQHGLTLQEIARLRHPSTGLSPLHVAAFAGADACLKAFLDDPEQGAALLHLKSEDSFNAAHFAAHAGHLSTLKLLHASGLSLSQATEDHQYRLSNFPIWLPGGRTPLHLAAIGDHLDCFQWLTEQGLDPFSHDSDDNNALALALLNDSQSILTWWEARTNAKIKGIPKEVLQKITSQDHKLLRRRLELNRKLVALKEGIAKLLSRQAQRQSAGVTLEAQSHSDPAVLKALGAEALAETYVEAATRGGGSLFSKVLTEEAPGVFSFDFMKPQYCERLVRAVAEAEGLRGSVRQPNSMNRYGCVMEEVGFGGMLDQLVFDWVRPLCEAVFPMAGRINDYYAFTIKYKLGEDVSLDTHRDSSDVTINVCLGKKFEGGTLYFQGGRSSALTQYPRHFLEKIEEKETLEYTHQVGKAVLHLGNHVHGAKPLTKGERWNLIVWMRARKAGEKAEEENSCG